MASKRGLGKGIDSIIPKGNAVIKNAPSTDDISVEGKVVNIKITKVERDKSQPRKDFDEDKLNDLAETIKEHGIFNPLIVTKKDDYYQIVAGERRWRAAKIAGLTEVPCIINDYSEQEKDMIQLLENVQREGLNPIEEALGYKVLIEKYKMKQDELAEKVGKDRTTIANIMRLLNLPEEVQEMVKDKKLSPGHARALLAIGNEEAMIELAQRVFDEQLSVRATEKEIKALGKPKKEKKLTPEALNLIYRKLEDQVREKIGAKVNIIPKDEKKGKLEIEYFSQSELEEIVNKITGKVN